MKLKIQTVIGLLTVLLISGSFSAVHANTVIRSGESVTFGADQVVEGDFYAASSKATLSGVVTEDLVVAGGQVTINGGVGADALVLAASAGFHGTIGDDLRVIAGDITIAKPVTGNVLAVGGTINILSTASIGGDLIVYGGDVVVEGSIGGDVLGTVNSLRVDASVAGDVDVSVGLLTLGDKAVVNGSVHYESASVLTRAPNATITGELVRSDPIIATSSDGSPLKILVLSLLVLLFSVLVWYWLSQRTLYAVVGRAVTPSLRPLLVGLLAFLVTPLLVAILLVSTIGGVLAIVLLFGYILFLLLSLVATPAVIGQLMLSAYGRFGKSFSPVPLVLGVIIIGVLSLLPFLGALVMIGFVMISFGAMVDLLISFLRPPRTTPVSKEPSA